MASTISKLWQKLKLPALLGAFLLVEFVSYLALRRYGRGIDGMPTVAWEEFPEIDEELLSKFKSFDPELGWAPQPNTVKQKDTGDHLPGEEVHNTVTYSTDAYGSRVCPAADRDTTSDAPTVSTYGDSYCFCREVDDDETFQHYLAERLDTHVANYGGGNYGFDQALLRLKRRYDDDPTDYVVIAVTASTMARVLSAWKHYQEFGNVLAVKPRFVREDGELRLKESPIDEKTDLLDIEDHAEFFHRYDHHYDPWFKDHLVGFPYSWDLFRDPDRVRFALYSGLVDLEERLGASLPLVDAGEGRSRSETRLDTKRAGYHEQLFEGESDLLEDLVAEFVDFSEENDFTPVFMMVQQLRYAKYDGGPIYGDLLDRLDERHPRLETIDMAEHLSGADDPESLYVKHGEGGHYSPETNARIAEILTETLFAGEEYAPQARREP